MLVCSLLSPSLAFAQMGLEGFSTGRYEIRKNKTPTVIQRNPTSQELNKPNPAPVSEAPKVREEPTLKEHAESLFSDNVEKVYGYYRSEVSEEDVRNNRMELEIFPSLVNSDSSSNSSYRDFRSHYSAIGLRANIWFTPRLGLTGKFSTSLGGDLDSVDGMQRHQAKYESAELGLRLRKFFGNTLQSKSIEFSALYVDDKLDVDGSSASRSKLESHGLGLGMRARLPSSDTHAWMVGAKLFPRLQHQEKVAASNVSSGAPTESTRLSFEVGSEFKLDRRDQIFWNISFESSKDLFEGAAALPNPGSAQPVQNVSAKTSSYIFSLGYRWGR